MTSLRAPIALAVLAILASSCGGSGESQAGPAERESATTAVIPVEGESATNTATPVDEDASEIALPTLKDAPRTELIVSTNPDDIALPTVTESNDAPGTGTPTGTSPTTLPAAEPRPSTAPIAPFPNSMAAIRGGEEILLIDTTTGTSSVIVQFSLLVDAENQVGPEFPFSVDVDPVAVAVRYDTCCDPDSSVTSVVDLATGVELTSIGGALPSVNASGSRLALSHSMTLDVVDTSTSAVTTLSRSDEQWFVGSTSWNREGSALAVEIHASSLGAPAIALVNPSAPNFDTAIVLQAPPGLSWTLPSFRADGSLLVVETSLDGSGRPTRIVALNAAGAVVDVIGLVDIDAVLDIDHDVSGQWLLIVDGEGDAFWFGPGGAGRLPGSGYSSASW